eukprot:5481463-Prymnesium_polylepis.2
MRRGEEGPHLLEDGLRRRADDVRQVVAPRRRRRERLDARHAAPPRASRVAFGIVDATALVGRAARRQVGRRAHVPRASEQRAAVLGRPAELGRRQLDGHRHR